MKKGCCFYGGISLSRQKDEILPFATARTALEGVVVSGTSASSHLYVESKHTCETKLTDSVARGRGVAGRNE